MWSTPGRGGAEEYVACRLFSRCGLDAHGGKSIYMHGCRCPAQGHSVAACRPPAVPALFSGVRRHSAGGQPQSDMGSAVEREGKEGSGGGGDYPQVSGPGVSRQGSLNQRRGGGSLIIPPCCSNIQSCCCSATQAGWRTLQKRRRRGRGGG